MRLLFAFLFIIPILSFTKKSEAAKHHSDQQLFVMIRKKAPFRLKDKDVEVRINKDRTFATELAAGGEPVRSGKWKIEKGLLKLTFAASKEVRTWPVGIARDRTPTIGGAPLKPGGYEIR